MNSSVALSVELWRTGRRRVAVAIGVIVRVVVDGLERRAGETGEHFGTVRRRHACLILFLFVFRLENASF